MLPKIYAAPTLNKELLGGLVDRIGTIGLRSRYAEKQYPWERFKKEMGTRPGMAW